MDFSMITDDGNTTHFSVKLDDIAEKLGIQPITKDIDEMIIDNYSGNKYSQSDFLMALAICVIETRENFSSKVREVLNKEAWAGQ